MQFFRSFYMHSSNLMCIIKLSSLHVSYLTVTLWVNSDSADSINRAWEILDQIPGRATGAYSHSQVKP